MGKGERWRKCILRRRRIKKRKPSSEGQPLREFVYLDEVSLTSLLASQTGEITAEVQNAMSQAEQAELASSLSASATVVKSEVSSRYQTTNSQSTQTTRKANVQSRFREFHRSVADRVLLRPDPTPVFEPDASCAQFLADSAYCVRQDSFARGTLVELNVELEADPIFKLSNMLSEVVDIAVEYPSLLGSTGLPAEAAQIGKVLNRLLAGLVPLRGACNEVAVIEFEDERWVVPVKVAEHFGVPSRPLTLVGVTDHLGYWKDIRRVLYSKSRYTVLCRIGREGIQNEWTPVKLADMFRDVAPEMATMFESAGNLSDSMLAGRTPNNHAGNDQLAHALRTFSGELVEDLGLHVGDEKQQVLAALAETCRTQSGTVTEQRELFDAVLKALDVQLAPTDYLERRRRARDLAQLGLFPSLNTARPLPTADDASRISEALLDVEFVAIYW